MTKLAILSGAAGVMLLAVLGGPASAQHVIPNPGRCAQYYPNANCQNYGPGNPYTSNGWRRSYNAYGHRGHRSHWGHRHHRYHWR
jgi:hypothetical protein